MALPRIRVTAAGEERLLHPNYLIYTKMEEVIHNMLDDQDGVSIKTVKSFLTKIPSVFTGIDVVAWIRANTDCEDTAEALHIAHLLACHGYLFPIDDHILTVKNDGTFYRFQTPYFWPSNCWEPENTDYAVYLCKRTMQTKAHLELEDFEAENLARLQRMFSRKWEFVFMQAEAQYKVDKKRDRLERQILDSQERAFWDLHRPVPGCVNTTEVDFRKLSRSGRGVRPGFSTKQTNSTGQPCAAPMLVHHAPAQLPPSPLARNTSAASTSLVTQAMLDNPDDTMDDRIMLEQLIHNLEHRLSKNWLKTSKCFESYVQYYDQKFKFDSFFVPSEPPNPWISDTVDFWNEDRITGEISARRIQLWKHSFHDLLSDEQGVAVFQEFLDHEYSGENLRFWTGVHKLRSCAVRMVPVHVTEIYHEFLTEQANSPVNVDNRVMAITEENLKNPNRYSFDEAADHIYKLMKTDSYNRFLRSEIYNALESRKKKISGKEKSSAGKLRDFASSFQSQKQREAGSSGL